MNVKPGYGSLKKTVLNPSVSRNCSFHEIASTGNNRTSEKLRVADIHYLLSAIISIRILVVF